MIKIFLQQVNHIEIDLIFPFHASYKDEDYEQFIKIDKDYFTSIKLYVSGTKEIHRHKIRNYCLSDFWYKNQCTENEYNEALKELKHYINKLD